MNKKLADKIFLLSLKLRDLVSHNKNQHFSFIVKRNKIISIGLNSPKRSHTFALRYFDYPFLHSEAKAILDFPHSKKLLRKCVLVNTRIDKSGNFNISKPCWYCKKILTDFKIKKVYYTDISGDFKKCHLPH